MLSFAWSSSPENQVSGMMFIIMEHSNLITF